MSRFRRALQAWHGSPYDYDEFKDQAIGSGEGAQAYGHGHYVAEARPVAEGYRDALTKSKPKGGWYFKGIPVEQSDAMRGAHDLADPVYAKPGGLKKFHQDIIHTAANWRDRFETYNRLKAQGLQGHEVSEDLVNSWNEQEKWMGENIQHFKFVKGPEVPGRLYEVHVALGDDEILDWDEKLKDHHPDAQKKLVSFKWASEDEGPFLAGTTGSSLHRAISADYGGPKKASQALLEAGIRGIRYRDAGSRQPSVDLYLDGEKIPEREWGNEAHAHRASLDSDWDRASMLAGLPSLKEGRIRTLEDLKKSIDANHGYRTLPTENDLPGWFEENKHRVQLKPSRGTYNYVVFDPKDIRIVRKYGLKNELVKDFGTEPVHLTNVEGDHQHG